MLSDTILDNGARSHTGDFSTCSLSATKGQKAQVQALLQDPEIFTQERIASQFFGVSQAADMAHYFLYYNREIQRLRVGVSPVVSTLVAKTHDDLLEISRIISQNRSLPRSGIRKKLLDYFKTEDHRGIDRSIDLTVRLWLMVNVRDPTLSLRQPEQPSVQWHDDYSIETFIDQQFRPSTVLLSYREARLAPQFTVANMVHICKLSIRWTENINHHLRLDLRSGRRALWVFPYKSLLVRQINTVVVDDKGTLQQRLLPTSLLRETILTLNLLFPSSDSATEDLLRQHDQTFHSIPPFDGPHRPSLDEFSFWKGRLLDLHEEIYKASPSTLTQLWRDRRNPHQWWAFWIVFIITPMTIISTVASVWQAVKT